MTIFFVIGFILFQISVRAGSGKPAAPAVEAAE